MTTDRYDDAVHSMALGGVLRSLALDHPTALAVVDGDVRLTTVQLDERVDRAAGALAGAGVAAGDRVLWLGQNSFRVLELLLAAARIGAVLVPVNWRQSQDELRFVLDDLDPKVVVWQEVELGDAARALRDGAPSTARWLQHDAPAGDPEGYEAFVAEGSTEAPDVVVDDGAPVLGIYTAAFSGRPSAALLSHRGLFVQDLIVARYQDIDHRTRYLNSGPLFHIGQMMVTLATFHHGGTNVFLPRVDVKEICRLVEEERVTHAFVPAPTFAELRDFPGRHDHDLSSLFGDVDDFEWRNVMVGPPTSTWSVHGGGYGQTEVGGVVTFRALGGSPAGPFGRSAPSANVRILDDEGADCPVGVVGEIAVQGPTVMVGYLNRPEENAARGRGGWHRTRDLGRREDDGSITFIGPAAKMIKSAAENIYPAEVETALRSHPAVAEVCVLGVPDERWGQLVKAVVVPADGATATAEELIEHCRASIASYKKPRLVELVDSLPKAGPFVDRDAVDELHGGGGYPGGTYGKERA